MYRVLIVDDDVELCELLKEYLQAENFFVDVVHVADDVFLQLDNNQYDIVVLDVMLSPANGFDVLRDIRKKFSIPVLMLTARGDDIDRIIGLENGADDYLAKPCNPRELTARIKAILRRVSPNEDVNKKTNHLLYSGGIEINTTKRHVKCNGIDLNLTNTEYNLLINFINNPNTAIAKEVLFEKILGRKMEPYDRSLDVHISNLRNKLERCQHCVSRIKTIYGFGYMYEINEDA